MPDNLVGGDNANQECTQCNSKNTEYEEYVSNGNETKLGIVCRDCEHYEDPYLFSLRFQPIKP